MSRFVSLGDYKTLDGVLVSNPRYSLSRCGKAEGDAKRMCFCQSGENRHNEAKRRIDMCEINPKHKKFFRLEAFTSDSKMSAEEVDENAS
jgi:hypothetical protein